MSDLDKRLASLWLRREDEHEQLASWNATARDYPGDLCLHTLFERQAARTPDATALVFDRREPRTKNQEPRTKNQEPSGEDSGSQFSVLGSGQGSQFSILTYAELDARANQLAHHLRSLGVGADSLVGVCAERSVELVVALYAILKAGGAYLPLDPSYPHERLRYMLEDAQVAVLLTNQEQRTKNKERKGVLHTPPANDERTYSTAPPPAHTPPANDERAYSTAPPPAHTPPANDERTYSTAPPPAHTPPANDERAYSTAPQPTVVDLVSDWPTIAQYPATPPACNIDAGNLAYAIYTSGSTGKPKGALIPHRAIVNRLLWMQEEYRLTSDDRVLQKTPFSFDVSVWEFFWPLLAGATLVVARPEGHKDPAYLAEVIKRERITTIHFVPPMLQVFLEDVGAPSCTSLRRVICSGEALPYELQERCFARLPQAELHNLYGPTEAAVDVSYWACRRDNARPIVPIGFPVANTQLYVLDKHMQPQPIGVPGELYIGGVQLGRGYLNRPDLTAERFVPCPWSVVSSQLQRTTDNGQRTTDNRLYRTGDLARYLPDGAIEYLGRLDHQVKIRGFRIELGEIEAALQQHPAVRAAVTIIREDWPGERRLVAYVVPGQEQRTKNKEQKGETPASQFSILNSQFSIQELRGFLKLKLPEYMVPAAFVMLDSIPLTPNGKVDRRALPAPEHPRAVRRGAASPRDRAELQIMQIWQQVLDTSPASMSSDFFELGGHPAQALHLAMEIRKRLAPSISTTALLQNVTIEAQASLLRQAAPALTHASLVPIQPAGARQPIFCFHPAVGNILCYHDLAQELGPDQPLYGLQAAGLEDERAPLTSIEDMASSYIEALRTVQPEGPYLLLGYCTGAVVAFAAAQLLRQAGQPIALLALIDGKAVLPSSTPIPSSTHVTAWFAWELARAVGKELTIPFAALQRLAPDAQLKYIFERACQSGVIPPATTLAQLQQALRVFRANVNAVRNYTTQPYADSITFFQAREGSAGNQSAIGWELIATRGVTRYIIPGDHYSMMRPPHIQTLAAQLHSCLDAVQAQPLPA